MRLVLILVILALLLAILGFAMTNLETRTAITVWQTTYQDVPLWSVVFLSALAGIVSVGVIAVVDGAFVRARYRQVVRELRRVETELNFLRTQPATPRLEPDAPSRAEAPDDADDEDEPARAPVPLATAPVYQPEDADDDDPYTGGRAV